MDGFFRTIGSKLGIQGGQQAVADDDEVRRLQEEQQRQALLDQARQQFEAAKQQAAQEAALVQQRTEQARSWFDQAKQAMGQQAQVVQQGAGQGAQQGLDQALSESAPIQALRAARQVPGAVASAQESQAQGRGLLGNTGLGQAVQGVQQGLTTENVEAAMRSGGPVEQAVRQGPIGALTGGRVNLTAPRGTPLGDLQERSTQGIMDLARGTTSLPRAAERVAGMVRAAETGRTGERHTGSILPGQAGGWEAKPGEAQGQLDLGERAKMAAGALVHGVPLALSVRSNPLYNVVPAAVKQALIATGADDESADMISNIAGFLTKEGGVEHAGKIDPKRLGKLGVLLQGMEEEERLAAELLTTAQRAKIGVGTLGGAAFGAAQGFATAREEGLSPQDTIKRMISSAADISEMGAAAGVRGAGAPRGGIGEDRAVIGEDGAARLPDGRAPTRPGETPPTRDLSLPPLGVTTGTGQITAREPVGRPDLAAAGKPALEPGFVAEGRALGQGDAGERTFRQITTDLAGARDETDLAAVMRDVTEAMATGDLSQEQAVTLRDAVRDAVRVRGVGAGARTEGAGVTDLRPEAAAREVPTERLGRNEPGRLSQEGFEDSLQEGFRQPAGEAGVVATSELGEPGTAEGLALMRDGTREQGQTFGALMAQIRRASGEVAPSRSVFGEDEEGGATFTPPQRGEVYGATDAWGLRAQAGAILRLGPDAVTPAQRDFLTATVNRALADAGAGRVVGPQRPGEPLPEGAPERDTVEPDPLRPEFAGRPAPGSDPRAGVWFSQMERVLEQKFRQPRMQAAQVRQLLLGNGVKKEELFWTGVGDYLDQAERERRPVERQALMDFAQQGRLPLSETVLGYLQTGGDPAAAQRAREHVQRQLERAAAEGAKPEVRQAVETAIGPLVDEISGAPRTEEDRGFRAEVFDRLLTPPTATPEGEPLEGPEDVARAWVEHMRDIEDTLVVATSLGRGAQGQARQDIRAVVREALRPVRRRVEDALTATQYINEQYRAGKEGAPEHAYYRSASDNNYTLRRGAEKSANPREALLRIGTAGRPAPNTNTTPEENLAAYERDERQNRDQDPLQRQIRDVSRFQVGSHFGGREGIVGSDRTHDDVLEDGTTTVHSNEQQSDIQQRGRKSGTYDLVEQARRANDPVDPTIKAQAEDYARAYEAALDAEFASQREAEQLQDYGGHRGAHAWAYRTMRARKRLRSREQALIQSAVPGEDVQATIREEYDTPGTTLNRLRNEASGEPDPDMDRTPAAKAYAQASLAMMEAEDAYHEGAFDQSQTARAERYRALAEVWQAEADRRQARYDAGETAGEDPREANERFRIIQEHLANARDEVERLSAPQGDEMYPRAPFPDNTIIEKLIERQLRDAADRGAGAMSWSTGQVIARRWSAGRIASRVRYHPGFNALYITPREGDPNHERQIRDVPPDRLALYVGPEAARHLTDPANLDAEGSATLSGTDIMTLDQKGQTMVQQYDRAMVSAANKIGKKYGATVERTRLRPPPGHDASEDPDLDAWAIRIPDAMRAGVQQGFPLFQRMELPEDRAAGAQGSRVEPQTRGRRAGRASAAASLVAPELEAGPTGPAELGGPEAEAEMTNPPGETPPVTPPEAALGPWHNPRAADEDAEGRLPGETLKQAQSRHQREQRTAYQQDVVTGRRAPRPHVRDLNAAQRERALRPDPEASAVAQRQTDALVDRVVAAAAAKGAGRLDAKAVQAKLDDVSARFQALTHRDHTLDLQQTAEGRALLTMAQQPRTEGRGAQSRVVPGVTPDQINEAIWRYLGRQPGVPMQGLETAPTGLTQVRGRRGVLEGAPEMRADDFSAILEHLGLKRTDSERGGQQADTSGGKFKYVDALGREQTGDSSSEVVFMRQLDRDPNVLYWQKSLGAAGEGWVPINTRYAEEATYAPDYFVVSRNPKTGEVHAEVIEVKNMGAFRQKEWRVPEKTAAARRFYEKLGIGYRIFNEDQLGGRAFARELAADPEGVLAGVRGHWRYATDAAARAEIVRRVTGAFVEGGEMMARMEASEFNAASDRPTTVRDLSGTGSGAITRQAQHMRLLLEQNNGEGLTYNPRTGESLGHLPRWFVSIPFPDPEDPGRDLETIIRGRLGARPGQEIGNGPNEFQVARFLARAQPYLDKYPFLNVGTWYNSQTQRTHLDLSAAVPDPTRAYEVGKRMSQEGIYSGITGDSADLLGGKPRPAPPTPEEVDRVLQELQRDYENAGDPTGTGLGAAGVDRPPAWAYAERSYADRAGPGVGPAERGGPAGAVQLPGRSGVSAAAPGVRDAGGTEPGDAGDAGVPALAGPAAPGALGEPLARQRPAPLDRGGYTSPAPTGERDLGPGAPFYGESEAGIAASPLGEPPERGGEPATPAPPGYEGPNPTGPVGQQLAAIGLAPAQPDVAATKIGGFPGEQPDLPGVRQVNQEMDQAPAVGDAGLRWVVPVTHDRKGMAGIQRVRNGSAANLLSAQARANHGRLADAWGQAFQAVQQGLLAKLGPRGDRRLENATAYGLWTQGDIQAVNVPAPDPATPKRIATNPHSTLVATIADLTGPGTTLSGFQTAQDWKHAVASAYAAKLSEDIVHELTHNEIEHNEHDRDPYWTERLRTNLNTSVTFTRATTKQLLAMLEENDFELLDQLASEAAHLHDAGVHGGPRWAVRDPLFAYDSVLKRVGGDATPGLARWTGPVRPGRPGAPTGPAALGGPESGAATGDGAGRGPGGPGLGRGVGPAVDAGGPAAGGPRPTGPGGNLGGLGDGAGRGAGPAGGVRPGAGEPPGLGDRVAGLRGGGPGRPETGLGEPGGADGRGTPGGGRPGVAFAAIAPGGAASPGGPAGAAPGGPGANNGPGGPVGPGAAPGAAPGAGPAGGPAPGGAAGQPGPQAAPTKLQTLGNGAKLGLLFSPQGLLRQLVGNAGTAIWQPVERAGAGAAAALNPLEKHTSAGTPTVRESGAMVASYLKNFGPAMKAMGEALKDPNATALAQGASPTTRAQPGNALHRKLSQWIDAGFRGLSVFDAATRVATAQAEREALEARNRIRTKQGRSTLSAADIKTRMEATGAYRTLTQDLDRFGQAVENFRQLPGGKVVIPFWQIPFNGMKYDLERSPAGLLKTVGQEVFDRKGQQALDPTERYERLSRGVLGSALSMALVLAYASGNLTGPEPDDPEEYKQWKAEGKTPFSVRVGDRWRPVTMVPGLNAALIQAGTVGDYIRRHDLEGRAWSPEEYHRLVNRLVTTTASYSVNRPFFEGVSELLQAGSRQARGNPDDGLLDVAGKQLAGVATGVIGSRMLRDIERTTSDTERAPRDQWERLQAGIPGLSGNVPVKRDAFGRVVKRPGGPVERALSPVLGTQSRSGFRRYEGARSPEEDAAIADAVRAVKAEEDARDKRLPLKPGEGPTPRQRILARSARETRDYGDFTGREKERKQAETRSSSNVAKMLAGGR